MATLMEASFGSIAETRKIVPSKRNATRYHESINDGSGSEWFGVDSAATVASVLDEGWADGVKRLNDALGSVEVPPVRSIKRRRIRADEGDELNIHDVYAGDLDLAWRRIGKREKAGPRRITLVANIGALGDVTADELFWRGASMLKLADALTEAGYTVKIIAVSSADKISADGFMDGWFQVTVKEFDQPLSVNSVASVICLAGYFRTVVFCWRSTMQKQVSGGWGRTNHTRVLQRFHGQKDCIVVDTDICNAETAGAWILRTVQNLEAA